MVVRNEEAPRPSPSGRPDVGAGAAEAGAVPIDAVLAERFVVRRVLGSGGMGRVYAAYDRETGRSVALKTLKRADADSLYRFKAEFRSLADVVHQNLVRLYELVADGDLWFFTMELVHGVPFLTWVQPQREGRRTQPTLMAGDALGELTGQPVPDVAHVDGERLVNAARQLALGVDAIHRAGKLHRDLKPPNVLVEQNGRVVVLDFGLVGDRASTPAHDTIDQSGMGTPIYMSPEQCRGAGAVAASDWYAVGVMLYRCLAGRPPHGGTVRDMFMLKQTQQAPPLPDAVTSAFGDIAALTMDLLQRDPQARPRGDEVLARLGVDQARRLSMLPPAAADSVVGRDAELAALLCLGEGTNRPALGVVRGPSGIGKTALVTEASRQLQERGALCLRGRCYERESVPFKAFDSVVDQLSHLLTKLDDEIRLDLIPEGASALVDLFPVFGRVPGITTSPRSSQLVRAEVRRRGFAAFATLLEVLCARQHVVVVLDDLQWADADSLALLEALLRPDAEAPPCRYFITLRDDAAGTRMRADLEAIVRLGDAATIVHVEVGALDAEAIGELVRDELDETTGMHAFVDAVVADAQGNPFVAKQLTRYLKSSATDAPPSERPNLASLIRERLRQLLPAMRAALEVLAVAGKPLSSRVLTEATALPPGALEALRAEKWIRHDTSSSLVEPIHDRIREEVAEQLTEERSRDLRERLVGALLSEADPDHEAIARHLLALDQGERASIHAEKAAASAMQNVAFSEAARLYELSLDTAALDADRRRTLQKKLAEALSAAGRGAEAARAFEAAARGAPMAEAMWCRGRAAEQLLVSGHVDEGFDALTEALEGLGVRAPYRNVAAAVELAALRLRMKVRGTDVRERDPETIDRQTLLTIDLCRVGSHTFAAIAPIVGAALQSRHTLLALESGHSEYAALGLAAEAGYRAYEGGTGHEESRRFLRLAEQIGGAEPSSRVEAYLAFVRGLQHHLLGETMDAAIELERAARLFSTRCENVFGELNLARTVLGVDLFMSGQLRKMARSYEVWLADARQRDDLLALTTHFAGGGAVNLWLVRDEAREAIACVHDAIASWPSRRIHSDRYWHHFALGIIAMYTGDVDALHEHARQFWAPEFRVFVSRLQARRVWATHLATVADLGLMAESKWKRLRLRRSVMRRIRSLRGERYGFAEAVADTSEAWLLHIEHNDEEAIRLLRRALRVHEIHRNDLFAHAIRMQIGHLLGGDEGADLVRSAEHALADEGARNPRRLARGQYPGFDPA